MKTTPVTLALDAHGGDHGANVVVPAALDALSDEPDLQIILAGASPELERVLGSRRHDRLAFAHAADVLAPDAGPVAVLRRGASSSMGRAVELVADGTAEACVSAGSTAALMALSIKRLGNLPGVRRPALMSTMPSARGFTAVLDLGANLIVDSMQLVQFAIMGVEARREEGLPDPSVGLLNVGHEDGKGHAVVRDAHERLRNLSLNYAGFVEGNDIFAGRVDVAVCDGFAGNLLLKSSEGLARMLLGELREALNASMRTRLAGWLARPAMGATVARLDPGTHNGAPLLGLRGVVVKSHGSADRNAMRHAISEAVREARRNLPQRIEQNIRHHEAGITK